jgi:hypothetical protein
MTHAADPLDELAALFLTEPDAARRRASEPPRATESELLLVGNLPVRAGVWLAPYADAVARTKGPTALLRLDDKSPVLQVLRADETALDRLGASGGLRETIAALQPVVSTWIVRPPIDAVPRELAEAGAGRITVLSGADETAVVAAYQMIKELAVAAEQSDRPLPPLGLALLGCDRSMAHEVVERLNRTTRSFLGVDLALSLCLPRMDAGLIASRQCRYPLEPYRSMNEILEWIGYGSPASTEPAAFAPAPASVSTPMPAPAPPPEDTAGRAAPPPADPVPASAPAPAPAPAPPPAAAPAPIPAPAGDSAPTEEPWVARRTEPLAPRAAIDIEPKGPCAPREPDDRGRPVPLASYVPGLETLPIRCPGHELVELAVDGKGRLHLLGPERTLRDMVVVKRWATDHRELIGMASPQRELDVRHAPRLHLFATSPLDVADLHLSDVQLHVLAPVTVDGKRGWYSAELNRVTG